MTKLFKWLGTFEDPDEAKQFVDDQAKRLTLLMLTDTFRVAVITDDNGHNVYLYKK